VKKFEEASPGCDSSGEAGDREGERQTKEKRSTECIPGENREKKVLGGRPAANRLVGFLLERKETATRCATQTDTS